MSSNFDDVGPYGPRLTPPSAIRQIKEEVWRHQGFELHLKRPANTDQLLDLPEIHYAFAQDEYLPYWPEIWPAARMLAQYLAEGKDWDRWAKPPEGHPEGIELGCGLGLPGLVALARGLPLTFTDYDGLALEYAMANAELNRLNGAKAFFLDWRKPPSDRTYSLILGSDLLYEPGKVQPLAQIIQHLLAPGGIALISDPDRGPAKRLASELFLVGLVCEPISVTLRESPDKEIAGTIYRIERSSAK